MKREGGCRIRKVAMNEVFWEQNLCGRVIEVCGGFGLVWFCGG